MKKKLMVGAVSLSAAKFAHVLDVAKPFFDEIIVNPYNRRLTPGEIAGLWDGATAIVAGTESYTAEMLKNAPDTLKVISRHGMGYDAVDIAAARAAGIKVCNTPGANAGTVADLAVGLMLSLLRKIPQQDHLIRTGRWERRIGNDMAGKTVGILGMGNIGKGVIRRCAGFDMKFIAYDPYFDEAFAKQYDVRPATAQEVLSQSDIVSLHLPSTPETEHFMNADTLALMKPTALLINTSRGALVDEDALYKALSGGQIGGAGLDVFSSEPLKESPLFSLDNTVLSPHQAGNSVEATVAMGTMAIENAMTVLRGEACKYIVNA